MWAAVHTTPPLHHPSAIPLVLTQHLCCHHKSAAGEGGREGGGREGGKGREGKGGRKGGREGGREVGREYSVGTQHLCCHHKSGR